jgi:hypothetical protein
MQKTGKKQIAALAAVQLYLQEEAEAANAQAALTAASQVPPMEPGQWAQSGRVDMMTGRRMIQMRAFSGAR